MTILYSFLCFFTFSIIFLLLFSGKTWHAVSLAIFIRSLSGYTNNIQFIGFNIQAFVSLALAVGILLFLRKSKKFKDSKLGPLLIFMILYILFFASLTAENILLHIRSALTWGSVLGTYIIVRDHIETKDVKKFLKWILIFSIVPVGIGIFQYATGKFFDYRLSGEGRVVSSLPTPSAFGMFLLISMFIAFLYTSLTSSRLVRRFNYGYITMLFILIILMRVRVTWFAIILSLFFILIVSPIKLRNKLKIIFVCIFLTVAFQSIIINRLKDIDINSIRINEILNNADKPLSHAQSNLQQRLWIWSHYIHQVDSIWTGEGLGMTTRNELHLEFWGIDAVPHSDWITAYVELGICGLFIFTLLITYSLFKAIKYCKIKKPYHPFNTISAAAIIALTTLSFTENFFFGYLILSGTFFIFIALMEKNVIDYIYQKKKNSLIQMS